uniref:Uncharacterized protein n=1 Tax=Plectus sambesii TaxID=2011161 RepID=A0A914VQT6_9BILA
MTRRRRRAGREAGKLGCGRARRATKSRQALGSYVCADRRDDAAQPARFAGCYVSGGQRRAPTVRARDSPPARRRRNWHFAMPRGEGTTTATKGERPYTLVNTALTIGRSWSAARDGTCALLRRLGDDCNKSMDDEWWQRETHAPI